jgi:hypothetical protein
LALALIDLDLFKSVNDRFGHSGGDEVLTKFAVTRARGERSSDVIGRLGGEEFRGADARYRPGPVGNAPASGCARRLSGVAWCWPAARWCRSR